MGQTAIIFFPEIHFNSNINIKSLFLHSISSPSQETYLIYIYSDHHFLPPKDMVNSYECSCAPGYTGGDCEHNIDDCQGSPCQNNGTCIDQINAYRCVCRQGFNGSNCETNIDDCTPAACSNGGRVWWTAFYLTNK